MLDNHENLFWLENVGNLFSSGSLIPRSMDSFEEQMNSISRLVFVIFLFLTSFYSSRSIFIITSVLLMIVICSYYCGKIFTPYHLKEPYGNVQSLHEPIPKVPTYTATNKINN